MDSTRTSLLLLTLALVALGACSTSNAPASGRAGLNQKLAQEVDQIETDLKNAASSEDEKEAYAKLSRMCLDNPMTCALSLTDSGGTPVSFGDWDQHRDELTGGNIEIVISHPGVGLSHTINHKIIDPVNIVLLLTE